MIQVLRVDDRLLHGQVAVAWTSHLKIDTILIANDRVIEDQTMQIAFKLAVPPGVTLSMKSLEGAVAVIQNPKHAARKIMVLTKNIQDADYICRRTEKAVSQVLIGGQRHGEGKKKIDMSAYLDEADMHALTNLNEQGVEVVVQAVPTSKRLTYKEIEKAFHQA